MACIDAQYLISRWSCLMLCFSNFITFTFVVNEMFLFDVFRSIYSQNAGDCRWRWNETFVDSGHDRFIGKSVLIFINLHLRNNLELVVDSEGLQNYSIKNCKSWNRQNSHNVERRLWNNFFDTTNDVTILKVFQPRQKCQVWMIKWKTFLGNCKNLINSNQLFFCTSSIPTNDFQSFHFSVSRVVSLNGTHPFASQIWTRIQLNCAIFVLWRVGDEERRVYLILDVLKSKRILRIFSELCFNFLHCWKRKDFSVESTVKSNVDCDTTSIRNLYHSREIHNRNQAPKVGTIAVPKHNLMARRAM